ncbi:MAG: hypothetical protein KDE27_15085 [Planctomycetes bacterium]|nr:hypothetical protein [Planctomycetota bacterium]
MAFEWVRVPHPRTEPGPAHAKSLIRLRIRLFCRIVSEIGKTTESFLAVTADVVGSRQSDDRPALQARLLEATAAVSAARRRDLAADVQLTAGDELQALLPKPPAAVALLQSLSDALHPVQLRFGLGWGPLTTPLPARRQARRLPLLDGPCFHRARAALAAAADRGAWATALGFDPIGAPLDALLELVGHLRQGWTEKQGLYAAAARERQQKEVAAAFEVSPSVVSESLKAANFELVRRGEDGLVALLTHFGNLTESATDSPEAPNPNPRRR